MPYDTSGKYYNDIPLTHCKECGKKLEMTNEVEMCNKCQQKLREIIVEVEE